MSRSGERSRTKVRPGASLIPEGLTSRDEVVGKRRRDSKTHSLGKGRFKLSVAMGPVHYKACPERSRRDSPGDPEWKEIDLTVLEEHGRLVIHEAPYDLEIYTARVGYCYTSKRGGRIAVELVEVGHGPATGRSLTVRHEDNQVFWNGLADGLEIQLVASATGVEIFKRLAHENAPRRFKWVIVEAVDGKARHNVQTAGIDADGKRLRIEVTVSQKERFRLPPVPSTGGIEGGILPPPRSVTGGIEGGSYERYTVEEVWTGQTGRVVNKRTRQKGWVSDVAYPVLIDATTGEIDVSADADDGHQYFYTYGTGPYGTYWCDGIVDYNLVGQTGAAPTWFVRHAGFRFASVGVPQGTPITSAILKVRVLGGAGSAPPVKWYGDNVDNAAAWSAGNLPNGIAKTPVAGVAWTPALAVAWHSIGITAPVQTIASRPGWAVNNAMRFAALRQGLGVSGQVKMGDCKGGAAYAAKLVVVYFTPHGLVDAVVAEATGTALAATLTADAGVTAVVASAIAESPVPTVTGSAAVAGVIAEAAAEAPSASVLAGVNLTAVVAAAAGAGVSPTVGGDASISAVVGAATGDALTPAVTGGTGAEISAVAGVAAAESLAPEVTGGTGDEVSAVVSAAVAESLPATITADAAVSAVIAAAAAESPAPGLAAGWNVAPVVAPATAIALSPTLTANALLVAVVASAQATAVAPEVGGAAELAAVLAAAAAAGLSPTITGGALLAGVVASGQASAAVPEISGAAELSATLAAAAAAGLSPTITGGALLAAAVAAAIGAGLPPMGIGAPGTDRIWVIDAEDRTMTVAAEDRTVTVPDQ